MRYYFCSPTSIERQRNPHERKSDGVAHGQRAANNSLACRPTDSSAWGRSGHAARLLVLLGQSLIATMGARTGQGREHQHAGDSQGGASFWSVTPAGGGLSDSPRRASSNLAASNRSAAVAKELPSTASCKANVAGAALPELTGLGGSMGFPSWTGILADGRPSDTSTES